MASSSSRRRIKGGFLAGSLMTIAILTITGFQVWWLKNNYDREKEGLRIATASSFQETIQKLQSSKMKLDKMNYQFDSVRVTATNTSMASGKRAMQRKIFRPPANPEKTKRSSGSVINLINLIQQKVQDSLGGLTDSLKRAGGIISIRNSSAHGMLLDSSVRIRLGSPPFMPMLDSLIKDPEKIKNIRIEERERGRKTISIVYNDDKGDKHIKDTFIAVMPKTFSVRSEGLDIDTHNEKATVDFKKAINEPIFRFLYNVDSVYAKDSVTIKEITTAYTKRLKDDNISVPFNVLKLDSSQPKSPDAVTIGFTNPISFELSLGNTLSYMLNKLKLPILFSLLLIGLTFAAFLMLYRNMMKQKRLAEMKNDLISNISHELKTPIATVGVALEALKSFNAIHDPVRTKEYLDISQGELQRLNLLVDKVLKLSIFEKKDIELKLERFDYKELTAEIMNSMRLQFEKYHAKVSMHSEGDSFYVDADKLHITSVVYNLLDNALKYSQEDPAIDVRLKTTEEFVELSVQDNGIGIAPEYKTKVFEKFFRVPTGDRHNIKGYGLGLSYVAEVVKRHKGQISVESEPGKGSTFTVRLPVAKTPVITLDSSVGSKKKTS